MKRNEVERHAPEARTDTNLPLDEAALDWLHDNHAHDLLGNHPQVIAQARAALTLSARVAECVRAAAAVTGTDAEMCATEAGADTNHGVVLAALDWQAKRVAELEGANVAATMAYADARVLAGQNAAHVNALRDALESITSLADEVRDSNTPEFMGLLSAGIGDAKRVWAAHPAADLAASSRAAGSRR